MASHQDRLVAFLKKDVGGAGLSNQQVKEFSSLCRELGIIDLSKTEYQEWVMKDPDGQTVLIQLVSWYSLGLLNNIKNIKDKIK